MATRRRPRIARNNRDETRGNIFADLGFDSKEAENLLVRAQLISQLRELVRRRKLTQVQAAKLFRVTQPRVSDLIRGKIHLFSTDTLIEMLSHAGLQVEVRVKPKAA
jgi:predicted XRE-type DNA-binding protein